MKLTCAFRHGLLLAGSALPLLLGCSNSTAAPQAAAGRAGSPALTPLSNPATAQAPATSAPPTQNVTPTTQAPSPQTPAAPVPGMASPAAAGQAALPPTTPAAIPPTTEQQPVSTGPEPSAGCQGGASKPGRTMEMLSGRGYVKYLPTGYDGKTPLPMVVDLHGAFQDGARQEALSKLKGLADPKEFVYVSPNGSGGNGGSNFVWDAVGDPDRMFVLDVVKAVEESACIDRSRIYATGCSNGGALDFLHACRDAEVFAAIAPMCAGSFIDLETECKPSRPVSVMFIIGESDSSACWEGDYAPVILPPIMTPCARKVQSAFSKLYSCTGKPTPTHGGTCETVDGCQEDAQVVICKTNTGHAVYGATNLKVAEDTWAFLRQFSTHGRVSLTP